jgi:hypothetical protein
MISGELFFFFFKLLKDWKFFYDRISGVCNVLNTLPIKVSVNIQNVLVQLWHLGLCKHK